MKKLKEIELNTQQVYEKEARAYDAQRNRSLFEKKWLDFFISKISKNADVLDVGCGSADPIARYLIKNNLNVVGIDYSQSMIDIAEKKFPSHRWIKEDMRNLKLERSFDGIIAWDSFFHLNQKDQVRTLGVFSGHLKEKGVIMFTAGPENSEVTGKVNGQLVYHSSLAVAEYKNKLDEFGIDLVKFKLNDPDCNFHSVFFGQKIK